MNKLSEIFSRGGTLAAFLVCGDPDIRSTVSFTKALAASGADIIGLCLPFSDATAAGSVTEAANLRALAAGTTTDEAFSAAEEIYRETGIPLVFLTYANVVFSYGAERFAERAAQSGVLGVILPDVPHEEREEFAPVFARYGIAWIPVVASSSGCRIRDIVCGAEGFVYALPMESGALVRTAALVRAACGLPLMAELSALDGACVGCAATVADGVIVSEALEALVGEYGKTSAPRLADAVRGIKRMLDRPQEK